MKPMYNTLKRNYYSSDYLNQSYFSAEDLYDELGYDIEKLTKQNPAYANTCATRMSLALINSGVQFHGRLKIKNGQYKGRTIETGAKLLADQLVQPSVFGYPSIIETPNPPLPELNNKKGVIFFWKISGYGGGHIDLIEVTNSAQLCSSHCYFACKEVWFWSLS